MAKDYPHETKGTTLLDVTHENERRRVYLHRHVGYVEVGEFTQGPITQLLYEWPVHVHCIHLPKDSVPDDLTKYFSVGEPFLADYMDELDARQESYGYLNTVANRYVSYRPARHRAGGRPPTNDSVR